MTARKYTPEEAERVAATKATLAWFDNLISSFENAVTVMRRRRKKFVDAVEGSTTATPINVISWVLTDIANISTNLRLDLAVIHAAVLTRWFKVEP